jgi:hypothetical protein
MMQIFNINHKIRMALAYRLDAISRYLGPNHPLPLSQVMDAACIKSITHGAE